MPKSLRSPAPLVSLAKPSDGSSSKEKPGRDELRTFDVQPDITKLLDQVGLTDDWIGTVIEAFVIDYVFDRPSVIAETMEELAPRRARYAATRIQRTNTTAAGPTVLSAPVQNTEGRRRAHSA